MKNTKAISWFLIATILISTINYVSGCSKYKLNGNGISNVIVNDIEKVEVDSLWFDYSEKELEFVDNPAKYLYYYIDTFYPIKDGYVALFAGATSDTYEPVGKILMYDQDLNLKLRKFIDVDSDYISFSNQSTIAYGEDGKIAVAICEWYPYNYDSFTVNKYDLSFYLFDYDGTILKHNVVEDGNAAPYSLIWRPLCKDYMMTCKGFVPYGYNSLTFMDNDFNLKKSHSFTYEFLEDMYVGSWRDENEFIVSTYKHPFEGGEYVLCPLIIDTAANIKKQTIIDRPDTTDFAADKYSSYFL